MNYIKRLELQVRLMADEIVRRENQRLGLLAYVQGPKFASNRYVAVEDVIVRLGGGLGTTGSFDGPPEQVRAVIDEYGREAGA